MYEAVNTDLGVLAERDESASLCGTESEAYENWFTRCIYVDERRDILLHRSPRCILFHDLSEIPELRSILVEIRENHCRNFNQKNKSTIVRNRMANFTPCRFPETLTLSLT